MDTIYMSRLLFPSALLLALAGLLRGVSMRTYYEIVLDEEDNLILYMDKMAAGWIDRSRLGMGDNHTNIYVDKGKSIRIAGKYLCRFARSPKATSCATATAATGAFDLVFNKGTNREIAMIMQDKTQVLAKGEFNHNTDMYDVVIVPKKSVPPKNYLLRVIKHDGDSFGIVTSTTPLE